jgi:hypothetical protein
LYPHRWGRPPPPPSFPPLPPPLTIVKTAAPMKAKEAMAASIASDKCCAFLDGCPQSDRLEAMMTLPPTPPLPPPPSPPAMMWPSSVELISGRSLGIFRRRHMWGQSPERQEEQRIGIASQRGGSGEYSTISYCDCKALDIGTPPKILHLF